MGIQIGSATARRGEIVNGWFEAIDLPTGGFDRFPVVVAQGSEDGPVVWLTTGVHGDEHTGLIVFHRLFTEALVSGLRGTVIAMGPLSPAGMRVKSRQSYYLEGDPNRCFPDPLGKVTYRSSQAIPAQEAAYEKVYNLIRETAPAAVLDLHNAWIGSVPFAFRDPVFYGRRLDGMGKLRSRREAEDLNRANGRLFDALGFTTINEFVAASYVNKDLHRSVSGAVLNGLGIPAVTVELGSWMYVQPEIVEAGIRAIRNVLRYFGMLADPVETLEMIPVIRPEYPIRRHMHPIVPQAGIVDMQVSPGDKITCGQTVAYLRDIFGNPLGKHGGRLVTEHDGFVLGWPHGVVRYKGEAVASLAIEDETDMVVSVPG